MSEPPNAQAYLDEEIRPRQALSPAFAKRILVLLLIYNLGLGGLLFVMGMTPLPIFLGADFLGLAIAFMAARQTARRFERIRITADHVTVHRGRAGVSNLVWRSATAFTRVEIARDRGEPVVELHLSGRRLAVAADLGAEARAALAEALTEAMHRARRERHPSHAE